MQRKGANVSLKSVDDLFSIFCHPIPGSDIGNVRSRRMIPVFTEAVAYSSRLIAQSKQIIERCTGLRLIMSIAGNQRHILQPIHDLVSTHKHIVQAFHSTQSADVAQDLHQNHGWREVLRPPPHGFREFPSHYTAACQQYRQLFAQGLFP